MTIEALAKNKIKLTPDYTARLDSLSKAEQTELANILWATYGETNRMWAVETYMARRFCRMIRKRGEIIPGDLLDIAMRKIHGDDEKRKARRT